MGMGRIAPAFLRSSITKSILRKLGMTMGQMPFSGEAPAMLAADPALKGHSGRYFQSKDGRLGVARSSIISNAPVVAARLWAGSEELCALPNAVPSTGH